MTRKYDIIGDIHGHADKLITLLKKMGYTERDGVWRHSERMAIFVGDFIDRGPKQVESVAIAKQMVEAGSAHAVLGNHELNAIAWYTPDPDKPVFIGHYWLTGEPKLLSAKVACVDYSAGKGGPLCAYRWDGEKILDSNHFCWADPKK